MEGENNVYLYHNNKIISQVSKVNLTINKKTIQSGITDRSINRSGSRRAQRQNTMSSTEVIHSVFIQEILSIYYEVSCYIRWKNLVHACLKELTIQRGR